MYYGSVSNFVRLYAGPPGAIISIRTVVESFDLCFVCFNLWLTFLLLHCRSYPPHVAQ